MAMSGLEYYEDSAPEQESGAGAPAAPVIYGQAPAGAKPSRYAVPTPKGGVPIAPSILEDMERIYQQKLASKDAFGDMIKNALAWAGTDRPNTTLESLAKRRESQEAEAAELFRMRSDIAAIRAQQEQAARAAEFLKGKTGAGGAQGVPGAAPSAPSGAREVLPSQIADQINDLIGMGDVAGAQKVYGDYMKSVSTETAKRLQHPDYNVPNVPVTFQDPDTGETREGMASRREIDQNPGKFSSIPTQEYAPAPVPGAVPPVPGAAPRAPAAPAAARPAPAIVQPKTYTYDELTPEYKSILEQSMINEGIRPRDSITRPEAANTFNSASLETRKQIFNDIADAIRQGRNYVITPEKRTPEMVAGVAPSAQAPAQPVAPTPTPQAAQAPKRKTLPEMQAEREIQKQLDISAAQEKLKTDAKKREVFDTNTDPMVVSERLTRARRAQDLVKNNPEIAGVVSGPGYKNAIAVLLQQGISTPSGSVSLSGLSEAIYKTLPTTIDTNKRYELAGILANMELDASAVMNGQGQISDGERKILQKAAISIEDPAEVVYKKAKMMEARQETLQKLREVYGDGSKYIRNFDAFKNDPQYKRIAKEYEDKLQAIADEKVKFEKKMPKGSTQPKSMRYDDAEKEKRYQEWARKQRGQ